MVRGKKNYLSMIRLELFVGIIFKTKDSKKYKHNLTFKDQVTESIVMISPMKRGDLECILGAKIDPVFGPIVMFGLGGIYAEVMKDIVFAEAPVNKEKAEQMISSLKSKDIFYGARGKPAVDINSLLNAIINLSNFIAANSDKVDQVEMNPILVSETEVIALDALIIKK